MWAGLVAVCPRGNACKLHHGDVCGLIYVAFYMHLVSLNVWRRGWLVSGTAQQSSRWLSVCKPYYYVYETQLNIRSRCCHGVMTVLELMSSQPRLLGGGGARVLGRKAFSGCGCVLALRCIAVSCTRPAGSMYAGFVQAAPWNASVIMLAGNRCGWSAVRLCWWCCVSGMCATTARAVHGRD
jgi:hypothetical protein